MCLVAAWRGCDRVAQVCPWPTSPQPHVETAETESLARPPPPLHVYLQYGVALTVEGVVLSAGRICGNPPASPCILGSGGGVDIHVGWRPKEEFYIGGAYEFSKQDRKNLYRLAILQQARVEVRHYFPTGKSAEPFLVLGRGALAGYGNEWILD